MLSLSIVSADKLVVHVPGWPESKLYAHAVISNGMVYVAGTIGANMTTTPPTLCSGGIANETACALQNIATALKAAGDGV